MKRFQKATLLIIFTLVFGILNGQSIDSISTYSFKDVNQRVLEKTAQYGANEVLIVLDIDNTILTSHIDLGGDIWYSWQRGKFKLKPDAADQLSDSCLFGSAIGYLYELGNMDLTDPLLPKYISSWQNNGLAVFALTSRSPNYRAATERELLKNSINFSSSPLKTMDDCMPTYSYKLEKEMSYINGIMMTTGMNKGDMLAHILGRTGRSYKAIVFVDDSEKNINNMLSKYREISDIDFSIFYYQKVVRDRTLRNNGDTITKAQADQMATDWRALDSTIKSIFKD